MTLDDPFHEGQRVWVQHADGSARPGIYVGSAELTWFGGSPSAYVVYPDSREGEEVEIDRVTPRDE